MTDKYQFDPIDAERLRTLGKLSPARRLRLMLNARKLAVGLIRGRLHQRYPGLSPTELNLKLLKELDRVQSEKT